MKIIKRVLIILMILLYIGNVVLCYVYSKKVNNFPKIKDVVLDNNDKIVIKSDSNDYSCYIGNDLKNVKWVKSVKNNCILNYTKYNKNIYLKNQYKKITKIKNNYNISKVKELKFKYNKIYMALNDTKKLEYQVEKIGNIKDSIKFSSENNNIAEVNSNGEVKGISNGSTIISVNYGSKKDKMEVLVTDKISIVNDEYNTNRPYVSCNMYSEEDNNLLDEILKDRIEKAGYKTRAGVVAAARFLTLEFPYKVAYFSENGRGDPYGVGSVVDGEGIYYHKGLYLNNSRTKTISKSMYGPAPWGCSIYSFPSEGYRNNGLDCSGYISWVIYNGGYEPGDLGAGVSSIPDMTDLGNKIVLTESLENNSIRVGDLLSGEGIEGGHIAMVVGIKDNNYYVTESLWFGKGDLGPVIKTYTIDSLKRGFYWHVDMNDYYIEDGNYTEHWSK